MTVARPNARVASVKKEIERLQGLDLESLRSAWRLKFKRDGGSLSRDILLRTLIWRIQEQAFGGYDRAMEAALNRFAGGQGNLGGAGNNRHVRTGTVLVREYRGCRHTVTIVPGGFVWRERIYSNLSKIAREITGVKWNGPRFFGLRQLKKSGAADMEGQR